MNTDAAESSIQQQASSADNNVAGLDELAQLFVAAQDALEDPMVTRLARAISDGIALVDQVTRNRALMDLLHDLATPESQKLLRGVSSAVRATSTAIQSGGQPAKGGLGGLWRAARQPGAEEGVRLLAVLSENIVKSIRDGEYRTS